MSLWPQPHRKGTCPETDTFPGPPGDLIDYIVDGMYAHIRNPYFLSYFIMFFSLLCIRPSLLLLVLILVVVVVFHQMVLKEERYLLGVHGTEYETYKNDTGRYLPRVK